MGPRPARPLVAKLEVGEVFAKHYDACYGEGESPWRRLGAMDKAANIVRLCGQVPHDRVLEIGSGEGAILQRLADVGFGKELHAVDISKSGVEVTRKRNIPTLKECRVFDGHTVPYKDASFDLVILSHVLEHVEYPRRLVYEAMRLAPHLFVEVPLEHTIQLPRDFVFDPVGHINFYSKKTIRRLLQSCGLEILQTAVTDNSFRAYKFKHGWKGLLLYAPRWVLLQVTPWLATGLAAYNCSLLCRRGPG